MKENNWYLYRHIRLDKNEPFYIGIGNKPNYYRAYEHAASKRNKIWNYIVNKSQWEIEILLINLTKIEASIKEQEFIRLYGRINMKTGILANMTNGEDGVWNCKRSEKTKQKIRESKLGSKNPQFGKTNSKETIEKRIIRLKIAWNNKTDEEKTKHTERGNHAIENQAIAVLVYNYKSGKLIGEYRSIRFAAKTLGIISNGKISQVLNKKRKQCHGYYFITKTGNEVKEYIEIIKTKKRRSEYSKQLIREKLSIITLQYTKDGKFVKEWPSVQSALDTLKIGHIDSVCRGDRPSAGGYIWRYKKYTLLSKIPYSTSS